MRVIAIANQKGGCGKTTTSINLSACLAFLGKKILLIDLDPQGHSSCGLGIRIEKSQKTVYELLRRPFGENFPAEETFRQVNPQMTLIPSDEVLSALEEELVHHPDRDERLKRELAVLEKKGHLFDFVILDCPPNLGVLTYNAFEAADEVIIPIEPSFFSLHGLAKISETLKLMNFRRQIPIEIHALLTLFNSRVTFSKEVYEEVKSHFQERLFKTIIHDSVLLKEAAGAGQSIVDYDPNSGAFRDYLNLAMEYLERDWDRILPQQKLGWNQIFSSRLGPKQVPGGILFQMMAKTAKTVEIAGDFNQWIPEALIRRDETGLWQKIIEVKDSSFRYKYIVDGEWQVDPFQPAKKVNAYGGFDSFFEPAGLPAAALRR